MHQNNNDPVKQKKTSERNVSSLEEKLDLHPIFNTAYKIWHQTSLVVQWLRLHAPNAEDQGLIPGQGSRSHMPKLRAQMLQLKIPHVAMKTPHLATKSQESQIKKKKIIALTLKKRTGITCPRPIPIPSSHTHHAGILLFCQSQKQLALWHFTMMSFCLASSTLCLNPFHQPGWLLNAKSVIYAKMHVLLRAAHKGCPMLSHFYHVYTGRDV